MNKLICFAFAVCALVAQAVTVSGVSARQRWPWNNLVDVTFTVAGSVGEAYSVELSAECSAGAHKLTCRTLLTEPIAHVGENRLVWDFGADYPDFRADDVKVSVLVTPFSDTTPVYMVIDVSGGVSASTYPVRYTTTAPVCSIGESDPCKTTEIWLKRVKAGLGRFGGNKNFGNPWHTCTLTKDYYLGIFPVTQAQWENVGSGLLSDAHSFFTNSTCSATRPVDNVTYYVVRGALGYPDDMSISNDSFIKRLRTKTGLEGIDLPSSWQWEYACRAGDYQNGSWSGCVIRRAANSIPDGTTVEEADSMWTEEYGTMYVDRGAPNPWGFYSMLGNVHEWTGNMALTITKDQVLPDNFKGPTPSGNAAASRVIRGGSWKSSEIYNCCYYSGRTRSWKTLGPGDSGFRIAIEVSSEEE